MTDHPKHDDAGRDEPGRSPEGPTEGATERAARVPRPGDLAREHHAPTTRVSPEYPASHSWSRRVAMRLGLAQPLGMPAYVPYMFLLPALAVFALFVFYPAIRIFILSFQQYSFVTDAVFIGLDNYRRLLTDSVFLYALLNSFLYLLVTPFLIVVSLAVAFLINQKLKGITFFRGLYFLPVVTPMIVVGIIWGWLLNEDVGLVNYFMMALGLTDSKIYWLTTYPLNLFSVMFVTSWKGLGYYAVIFLAGLMTIPKELEEVSALDGANAWQQLIWVKLPLLKPTIALVAIISSISALKVFDELYVMIPGAPAAEKTLVPLIYQVAFLDFRLGYASAISVVLFVITLIFSYFNLRYWERPS